MTGAYLLLRRHMGTISPTRVYRHRRAPPVFGYSPSPQTAGVYLSSVFTTPEEQPYLGTIGLAPPENLWKPAIFEIEDRIFNRATSLLFRSYASDNISYLPPPAKLPVEGPGGNAASHLDIPKSARRAIEGVCTLSRLHNFGLQIITAPTPKSIYLKWEIDSRISKFLNLIREIAGPTCHNTAFTDINEIVPFPDHTFRDPSHLRRPGWANLYARILRNLITKLN
jgi:hypothetical protein